MSLRAVFFGSDDRARLDQVQALRKAIFVDHCEWRLEVEDGRERDAFDGPDAVHLLLLQDDAACGCFRALRTDRPYLAKVVFPGLAVMAPYPSRPDVWEVSRFGVTPGHRAADLGRINYALMFAFANRVGASALVAIADLAHERFLRSLGIRTRRYGPPREIGRDLAGRPLRAVAGEIALASQNASRLSAILSSIHDVEINDASEIFGPGRVSA